MAFSLSGNFNLLLFSLIIFIPFSPCKVISQGTAERTQGMSGVNPLSSRSHALLQIQLRDANRQVVGRWEPKMFYHIYSEVSGLF